jgi:hypothetical protein
MSPTFNSFLMDATRWAPTIMVPLAAWENGGSRVGSATLNSSVAAPCWRHALTEPVAAALPVVVGVTSACLHPYPLPSRWCWEGRLEKQKVLYWAPISTGFGCLRLDGAFWVRIDWEMTGFAQDSAGGRSYLWVLIGLASAGRRNTAAILVHHHSTNDDNCFHLKLLFIKQI